MFSYMSASVRSGWSISTERAKTAIRDTGLTQRAIAKQLGIDETKLSKTLAGTRRFTNQEFTAFTEITGSDRESLLDAEHSAATEPASNRDKVLNTAWQLFSARGYDQVRIADIADHAGVSAASVMYHFKSKPAIYLTCLQQVTDRSTQSVTELLAGPGTSFAKLYQLTTAHLPDDKETRRQWAVWMQFWGSTPTHDAIKAATQDSYTAWYGAIAELVLLTQYDGWLPDDPLFTETLTALIDGLGIRVMSGLATPAAAREVLHEFYTSRLQEPHPL